MGKRKLYPFLRSHNLDATEFSVRLPAVDKASSVGWLYGD